jgi:hypothetical protein
MANANVTGLGYLGSRISFRDMDFFDLMQQSGVKGFSEYRMGLVVAVQVPHVESGVETLLLVRNIDTQSEDYFRLDRIEIEEVFTVDG